VPEWQELVGDPWDIMPVRLTQNPLRLEKFFCAFFCVCSVLSCLVLYTPRAGRTFPAGEGGCAAGSLPPSHYLKLDLCVLSTGEISYLVCLLPPIPEGPGRIRRGRTGTAPVYLAKRSNLRRMAASAPLDTRGGGVGRREMPAGVELVLYHLGDSPCAVSSAFRSHK
jgi:hypothetical protein